MRPTPELNQFWQAFMAQHPHKITDIQMATDYIKTIQFREIEPSEADLARLKQRIWDDIDHPVKALPVDQQSGPGRLVPDWTVPDQLVRDYPVRVITWYQRPYWVAAAILLLVSSLGIVWWQYNADFSYQTAYGKIQEIQLADGSVVTLNGNSTLRVAKNLAQSPVREVWLDGEGYFDIAKRKGAKFIVHTAEAQIEVLGTEFDVNSRRAQTNVVLHEGKVQLTANNAPPVVMKPGDMAIVTPHRPQIQLKRVQPAQYDAWKESYLVLDGKTLPEIINSLQDTFGVTIRLGDKQLADKKLSGKLRTSVIEDCIDNLALILDADVQKDGSTYVINQ
ncbi:FecR family protein [Spirosoma spitsbergense]|uniref:FecR family protein n=1 Tax=Spirosoma spitsbergense TaxID=431554 RepID=UPI000377BCD5|nr:FecR domain-containing protein [Spirosoma spitsbergense]